MNKNKNIFLVGSIVFSLLALALFSVQPAQAQVPSIHDAKPNSKNLKVNKATLPPAPVEVTSLVPILEVSSTKSPRDKNGQIEPYMIVGLRIVNREDFPAELFRPEPHLPPDPCKQAKSDERMWLEVFRTDNKERVKCMAIKNRDALAAFVFRMGTGRVPPLNAVLTDVKTGTVYKSKVLDMNAK